MARRGENIYKRKDHRWEGRYKIGADALGRGVYRSVYAQSYTECKDKLKAAMRQKTAKKPIHAGSAYSFAQVSGQWLESIRPLVKISSFAAYSYILTRYLQCFMSANMEQLTKPVGEAYITMLLKRGAKGGKRGLAVRTAGNILAVLKMVCTFAQARYAVRNEIRQVRLPKQRNIKGMVLSAGEWERMMRALSSQNEETALAVSIGMHTGMRIGEICALKREDIDLEEKIIHVRKTVQRVKNLEENCGKKTKLILGEPKSGSSHREIPIKQALLKKLKKICEARKEGTFLLGIDETKPLDPRTLQYRFKAFLKKVEAKEMNFHGLRHSFATRCVEKKMDIKSLSEILGHASVKMTLDRYVHSSMEHKRAQMEQLEEAM